jgi:hypothetical protein
MNVDTQNTLIKLQNNELTAGRLIAEIEHQTDLPVIYRNRVDYSGNFAIHTYTKIEALRIRSVIC